MSRNQTPAADRLHIGFFGRRNVGKSSLVNAVTGQALSVVSDVKGTTTDPVSKAMELLPLGPVLILDTPGIDDEGALGALRIQKTREVLRKVDVAVLVTEAGHPETDAERELIALFQEREIPYLVAVNKTDLTAAEVAPPAIAVSAATGDGVESLKEALGRLAAERGENRRILGDLLVPQDVVVLVTPIDAAAPKGRLILPQQQTLRDILDSHAIAVVTQTDELAGTLSALGRPPKMVVTDSQAFGAVSQIVPSTIPLTSFSILMARYKGNLSAAVAGAAALDKLQNGDTVLISEGCTHHRQCGDIGTQKLPAWIQKHTGKTLQFAFTSGGEFPSDLSPYALVVHCGGCMLNEREMRFRAKTAADAAIPMTNYGIAIAHCHGILRRSLSPFAELAVLLDN
ncbi:MAG: [Clostridia bacterium]|nr:[FeFe] hydrogenase H-cluster maturation GTPase HydF [Clostridia bacterium]